MNNYELLASGSVAVSGLTWSMYQSATQESRVNLRMWTDDGEVFQTLVSVPLDYALGYLGEQMTEDMRGDLGI